MKSDEELTRAAEELHARGELSVNRLQNHVGGGDRDRLAKIARRVREESASRSAGPVPASEPSAENGLPETVRIGLNRLETAILSALDAVRNAEVERSRLAEAGAAARHQEELRAAERHAMLLSEDLDACEREIADLQEQNGRLTAALVNAENSLRSSDDLRHAESEAHSRERLALTEALSRAQDDAATHAAARATAEAAAAGAVSAAAAATSELERVREECVGLRSRNDVLLRQLTTAEVERDRALADLRDVTAALTRQVGKTDAPMLEPGSTEKSAARRRKRSGSAV